MGLVWGCAEKSEGDSDMSHFLRPDKTTLQAEITSPRSMSWETTLGDGAVVRLRFGVEHRFKFRSTGQINFPQSRIT
jgi:hypothetical protein